MQYLQTLRLGALCLCAVWMSACASTGPQQRQAIKPDPAKSAQIAQQAQSKYDAGNFREADGYAKVALALDGDNATALRLAAQIALFRNEPETAIRHYAVLREQASDPDVEGHLGLAYLRSGDADSAKPFLMSALASDPTRWREALALATIERDSGNLQKARDLLSLAEKHSDRPAIVAREIGRVEALSGHYAQALVAYERANPSPLDTNALEIEHRIALAHSGRMDAALEGANATEQSRIYGSLARDAIGKSDKVAAVSLLKRARHASPRHDTVIEELMAEALQLNG